MRTLILTLFAVITTVAVVSAQSIDCPTTVEQALRSVSELCAPLGRNFACYGSSVVQSTTFEQPRPADFFTAPGDISELRRLREIRPRPLNILTGTFGAAVLNAQANLPNTLPGQSIIFLLMGDARLTNEVPPATDRQLPFQSFYFLPTLGRSRCYEAEPMLTIQTPGSTSVTINFNGVETEMSPGTLLTITPFVCTIHRGYITQRVGDDVANLLTNQTVDIHIESNGTIVVDNLRGISEREYQRGLSVQDALNTLTANNGWSAQLISPLSTFDAEPGAATPTAAAPASSACVAQVTVQPGDTLLRFARQYGTTASAIAAANSLSNPNLIFPGQTLCIPPPG